MPLRMTEKTTRSTSFEAVVGALVRASTLGSGSAPGSPRRTRARATTGRNGSARGRVANSRRRRLSVRRMRRARRQGDVVAVLVRRGRDSVADRAVLPDGVRGVPVLRELVERFGRGVA